MKKRMMILGGAAALIVAVTAGCAPRSIAKVNGQNITQEAFYQKLEQTGGRRMLDAMITRALVEQEAKSKNITVSPIEVAAQIKAIEEQMGGKAQFDQSLAQSGSTRKDAEEDVALQFMVFRLVTTEAEVKAYFEKNQKLFDKPATVRYRRIVVATREDANLIRKELNAPNADFATIAREKSADPYFQPQGGELPALPTADMAKYDDDAAAALAKLKPGAISGVIPLSKDAFAEVMPLGKAGFQIVQLVERKAAQKATLEDSRFQVMNGLMREKEQDIQALLRSLKAKANVQITDAKYQELAQEYQRAKEMTPPAASPGATTPATAPTAPAAGQGSGR